MLNLVPLETFSTIYIMSSGDISSMAGALSACEEYAMIMDRMSEMIVSTYGQVSLEETLKDG